RRAPKLERAGLRPNPDRETMAVIEEFLKAHQYTIAALGVLATFSAVVVSLGVAFATHRANRTRTTARAAISIILDETIDPKNAPTYLTVSITNHGLLTAAIPLFFFFWKIPLRHGLFMVNPLDYGGGDRWIARRIYPFDIRPRTSETFFLSDIATFREMFRERFLT